MLVYSVHRYESAVSMFFNSLHFYWSVVILNIVLVSAIRQQGEPVIHISTPLGSFPYTSLQTAEEGSLCHTVGLY